MLHISHAQHTHVSQCIHISTYHAHKTPQHPIEATHVHVHTHIHTINHIKERNCTYRHIQENAGHFTKWKKPVIESKCSKSYGI